MSKEIFEFKTFKGYGDIAADLTEITTEGWEVVYIFREVLDLTIGGRDFIYTIIAKRLFKK